MADLTAPSINVSFKEAAASVKTSGARSVLAIVVTEADVEDTTVYTLNSIADIPSGITTANVGYVTRAFIGGDMAPTRILLCVSDSLANGLSEMKKHSFAWIVGPHDMSSSDTTTFITWIKGCWTDGNCVRAIVPNNTADFAGIVNLATDAIVGTDGTEYTAATYMSRIAGLICGTEASKSITNAELTDLKSVTAKSMTDINNAIKEGKLVLVDDGEKVKISRGVTSITTMTGYTEAYKKIRLVDIICTIKSELKKLINDKYIGKFVNTYDNKCALVAAIEDYLTGIAAEGMIEDASSSEIDVEAQRAWLITNVDPKAKDWSDDAVKQANTGSKVFVKCAISLLDAVEDVEIAVEY